MSKEVKKYAKNNNTLDDIDKFILENFSKHIKTPYYIQQNIKKTIDYLFLNNNK